MKKTMMKTMMKKMTKKNEKMDILSKKIVKKLQPRPTEDDVEIFADISNETMTLYVCTVTIKSFSSVPI